MQLLPDDPTSDPEIRARAWILKALRERHENAHHIIAGALLGLDKTTAIRIVQQLAEDSATAEELDEVMGPAWADDILASDWAAPHVRALEDQEAEAQAVAALDPGDVARHLMWEWAARQGLIDSVGGWEWRHRQEGTDLAGETWVEEHRRIMRVIDGDFAGGVVSEKLAEAVMRGVRRE